jgi:putative endonuclease
MEKTNSHFFYVLECADKSYYAGYTNNIDKRVAAHNAGKGAKYTKARGPVECIYVETFDTKQEAMRAEYAFKQLTRAQKTKYIGRDKS